MQNYGNSSGFKNYGYPQYNGNPNFKYINNNYKPPNFNNSTELIYNYKNNISNESLKIEEALSKSSYPKYNKDFIKNFLINNYYNHKNAKIYLTLNDKEKIFVIEYNLPISFNYRIYNVFILVYLPLLYPDYPPEFYIGKRGNMGINQNYENGRINSRDLRINLSSFIDFDPERNNIEEIINKIKEEFNNEFPVYKNNRDSNNILGKCNLDKKLVSEIIIDNKAFWNNDKERFNKNMFDDINEDKNKEFNDKTFLDFMRNQVKDIIKAKYMDLDDKFQIKKKYNDLFVIKDAVRNKKEKNILNKDINIMKQELENLKKIKEQYIMMENNLKYENDKILNDKRSIFERINEVIKIKDEKELEYISKKKAIEDYLLYLKKGYERKIVSFDDMINQTRILSRELFNIDYIIKKIKYFRNQQNY